MTCNRDMLRADLIRDEGESLTPYRDSLGHMTIGVGHFVRPGDGFMGRSYIARAESRAQLDRDIDEAIRQLTGALPWAEMLDEVRARAFVELVFNVGIGGLLGFRKMLAHAKAGEWADAALDLMDSRWSRQVDDGPDGRRFGRADRLALMVRDGTPAAVAT